MTVESGRSADHQDPARRRRQGHPHGPPRPPEGQGRPELSSGSRLPPAPGELLGTKRAAGQATPTVRTPRFKVAAMNDGDVVLLGERSLQPGGNLRDADERAAYAKKIAAPGEAFCLPTASGGPPRCGLQLRRCRRSAAAAGPLVEKEAGGPRSKATENPERPFTVVLGGSVSDKLRRHREPARQG